MNVMNYLESYNEINFTITPLKKRTKEPFIKDWNSKKGIDMDVFDNDKDLNVGLVLGENSDGVVDVDIDEPGLISIAQSVLPSSGVRFGRPSKPSSHYLYRINGDLGATRRYNDPEPTTGVSATIIELRSTGCCTMVPPSVHPSGEKVEFEPGHGLTEIGFKFTVTWEELEKPVAELAATGLLLRRWDQGKRHNLSLALGGALARAGWDEERAQGFVSRVAQAARDNEIADRERAVADSFEKVRARQPATGVPLV